MDSDGLPRQPLPHAPVDPAVRPLAGLRVVVTRPRHQRSALIDRLTALGAEAVSVPTIDIVDPLDEGQALAAAIGELQNYAWVAFTSANAVSRFCGLLRDPRDLAGVHIAAIGTATVAELARHALVADLVPERFIAESLLEVFPLPDPHAGRDRGSPSGRVLIPSAEVTRDVLPKGLRELGWSVDVVTAYRTVPAVITAAERAEVASADAVTFTSGSTVDQWVAAFGVETVPPIVACIGPVTADVARRHGFRITVIAEVHTVDGLVDALIAHRAQANDPPAETAASGSRADSGQPRPNSLSGARSGARIGRRKGRA